MRYKFMKYSTIGLICIILIVHLPSIIGMENKSPSIYYESLINNDDTCYPVFDGTMSNGWYTSPVEVSFVYDPEIVAMIYYNYNGYWLQYDEPFVILEQGLFDFDWYYIDSEGYESSINSASLAIDYSPPEFEVTWETYKYNGKWYVDFICEATDGISGMDRIEFFINDGHHETITGSGPTFVFSIIWLKSLKKSTFKFEFYDNAGNPSIVLINGSDIKSSPLPRLDIEYPIEDGPYIIYLCGKVDAYGYSQVVFHLGPIWIVEYPRSHVLNTKPGCRIIINGKPMALPSDYVVELDGFKGIGPGYMFVIKPAIFRTRAIGTCDALTLFEK